MKTLARLVVFLQPFAGLTALSVLLGAGTVAAGVGLLGTSAHLIASAALHPSVATLQVAIVGVRFFGIARAVLRYLERLVSHSVNFKLLAGLRLWFYNALEPLAPARLVNYRSGDLLARSVADIETLENFYVRAVAPPLSALVVTGGVSLFTGRYDLRLGLLLAAALVAAGGGLPLLAHALSREPGKELVARRAALQAGVVDVLQGMPDLLAFGQEQVYLERVIRAGRALEVTQFRRVRAGAVINALSLLISGLALAGVLLIGIPLVGTRLDGVALAVLSLVTLASFEAVTPLSQAAQHLQSSLSAAGRLFDLVDAPPEVVPAAQPIPAPSGAALSIRGLTFRYAPDLPPALDHFSLDLPPGRHVALVGPSGAGKSTLFSLLLRFWDYSQGEILLDGCDLKSYDPDDVRRAMGTAPQSTYLFAGTLCQNLLMSAPEAGETELQSAVAQAGLAEWAAQLPQGLDTWVGERGVQISGGERRRVVLARALLCAAGRARLLLLDEPTAHLDAVTEQHFLRDLQQAAKGRSLLLITHRLVGLESMDEIIVLENGRAVERGTHAELLAAGGVYAHMWKIQRNVV